MALTHRKAGTVHTASIRMPKCLYEQARHVVRVREDVDSFNEFVLDALRDKLRELREEEIDASVQQLANDEAYQRESEIIEKQFRTADLRAANLTEPQESAHQSPISASAPAAAVTR